MRISVVCEQLPEGLLPRVSVGRLVSADESTTRLEVAQGRCAQAAMAAMWAAVEATRQKGVWSRFDLRPLGARGSVHTMDHWCSGGDGMIREGFLLLVQFNVAMVDDVPSTYRFTNTGVELITT